MSNLYPKAVYRTVIAFLFIFISSSQGVFAQCPAGSVSPVNNATYGNGQVICLSGVFSQTITLNSGSQLIITNTASFTGTVNAKSGSVITVQAGGTFTPSGFTNFAGKIVNAGNAVFGSNSSIAAAAIFENTGTMSFNNGINYYGTNTELKNLDYGTMYYNTDLQLPSGGVLLNKGVLFTKSLTISSNASFNNRGKAYVIGSLSLDGKLVNDYLLVIKGTTSKQATDSLINYNMIVFDGDANFNGGVRNEGLFWFTSGQTSFHNGVLVQDNPNALTRINSSLFYNNAAIGGTGGFYSALIPVQSDGSLKGFNATSPLMTNFPATSVSNNAWSPSSNTNLNGIASASFPLFDTLSYVATWANPAAAYAHTAILPIVLGDFNAAPQQTAVLIRWTTLSEINGEYMILQHSSNGTTFTDLTKITSSASSATSRYQYLHQNPSQGINYYRLKMVSADEGVKYSSISTAKFATSAIASSQLRVYPNPFSSQLQVKYTVSIRGDVNIRLISTEGKIVLTKSIVYESTGNHLLTLNTDSDLKAGIYFLEVKTADGTSQQKILKQ